MNTVRILTMPSVTEPVLGKNMTVRTGLLRVKHTDQEMAAAHRTIATQVAVAAAAAVVSAAATRFQLRYFSLQRSQRISV